ncbi:NDP-glycosyltransferase YjiC-like [Panonychus citri]|uniref:NDP-glycosyltransferase YjiC-like n=1 Tax=Panonychus citri TaxID=50023 RepID=UPI00230824C7|nr:NDP-glycosyltransferase YjiC-like [Panonychus citri]XP_053210972.1 NDP-glycosyltransferase YjiC-like [Panonychus citri]XP_053212507.1 NDP-glycosyltransferase YjiC-like [Panonychus citri]XP_053214069.1 NDP-glycosyltransferase YjiC-like [Panonychus citri]
MKIVFIPMDAYGHVNSCVGLARNLMPFGHEISFIVPTNWIKTVQGNGFAIESVQISGYEKDVDPQSGFGTFMDKRNETYEMEPLDKFKHLNVPMHDYFLEFLIKCNEQYEKLLTKINPDLIIFDHWTTVPAIVKHGVPYMLLWSCSPTLPYWKVGGPSYSSGLGIDDGPEKIQRFRDDLKDCMKEIVVKFNHYFSSEGLDMETLDYLDFTVLGRSPYLNLYSYPEDLDYSEFGPVPDKWFRLDHMVRIEDNAAPLGISEDFFNTESKVILFTLGSLGTSNYQLLTRLIDILASSKHKFIVSMGIHHDKIKLPANMTGSQFLNQMKIMPRVDMVIHHGGNNSLVETLYFGKPFMVLPLFGDQHDNGRRVIDKKLAKSFHPLRVTSDELLSAIDETLADHKLAERIQSISKKIRETQSYNNLNEKLIEIVDQHKQSK